MSFTNLDSSSKYYDYRFIRTLSSNKDQMFYYLSSPKDSVSTNYIFIEQAGKVGTTERAIKDHCEYFLNQMQSADTFTKRVHDAIMTNMPVDGAALAFEAFINAVNSYVQKPSIMNFVQAIEAAIKAIPGVSLVAAVIEILTLGPVIWTNLYNCRQSIDAVKRLK
ncbi:hypothetical protein SAMN05192551_10881 [Tindallia magadiensis]|uniref:Uncharacterized protein n=1 Tax=Tindallia magadiensis TaxID=69895 RepID=A0A1I3GAU4_9FIRM|nr:hypothetical protein [Tindallia magadiensis]SFI20352.1 hypothetical protein SAMN05192551_10881 [Tindallia magadiensis]